jgi:hypothetical protein
MSYLLQNPSRDVLRSVRNQISDQAHELNRIQLTRNTAERRLLINRAMDQNRKHQLRKQYEHYNRVKQTLWIENPLSLLYPNSDSLSYFTLVPLVAWTTDGVFEWIVLNLNNITRVCWLVAAVIYASSNSGQPVNQSPALVACLVAPLVIACVAKSALIRQDAAFDKELEPLNANMISLQRELDALAQQEMVTTIKPPPNVENIVDPNTKNVISASTEKYYLGRRSFKPLTSTRDIIRKSVLGKTERLAQYTGSFASPPNNAPITWPKVVQ